MGILGYVVAVWCLVIFVLVTIGCRWHDAIGPASVITHEGPES